MNDGVVTHPCGKTPTLALNKILGMTCQCRDFPTELICNTIIHIIFPNKFFITRFCFIFKLL